LAMEKTSSRSDSDKLDLQQHAAPLSKAALVCAAVGLIAAVVLGMLHGDSGRQFFFAYLTGYMYFLSIALGGLFFTIVQHLTKAAWSVNVRRIAEWLAASMPMMAGLSIPIVAAILLQHGSLYKWSLSDERLAMPHFRSVYLNPFFVVLRLAVYFTLWSVIGRWYWRQSLEQDKSSDFNITRRLQYRAAPAMLVFAVTLTLCAFDLLMSLDPNWSSTIFGVYIFAGSTISIFATIILTVILLQSRGYLRESVTHEHFHDLGKFLFAFTFFFGYIAFSQFMLQWYGNIPEETEWYRHRGATTAIGAANGWSVVIIMILFGHVLIPFAGLLSRHVKRNPKFLGFWAAWLLFFHWWDLLWIVRPEMRADHGFDIGLVDLAVFVGIGGALLWTVVGKAGQASLRPLHDPRLADSLAFENV